jgi:hypothetical protein
MNDHYCVLVSSCDAYADCWPPFFTLFAEYWRPHEHAIYLNTETQSFTFADLAIHCPRVSLVAGRSLGWSERLRRCLERIPYEIVLYLQEDYFLKSSVDVATLDHLAALMCDRDMSHISLERDLRHRDQIPGRKASHRFLSHVGQRAEYRINAQAALWNVKALKSYLRSHETVWEFEWYGTRRAWRKPDSFFYVDEEYREITGREKIFPYEATGIVQGRWVREVVADLFRDHHIVVDFGGRGFLEDHGYAMSRRPRIVRAARRLRSIL